ncbi:hypothetical protein KEM54_005517 [Ascosphaera aggregata]|nr:hypothetical protein KEM54_005517 [Ascosphaera aggregata]
MAERKPTVLIVGGLSYFGRFLAHHLHKNNLASDVRLVDKILPQLAYLPPEMEGACSMDKFVQADPAREREYPNHKASGVANPGLGIANHRQPHLESLPRIFDRADGQEFDYVIDYYGEWRLSQPEEVYRLRSHLPTVTLAKEAARRGVKAFIELSTATIYSATKKPAKEGASEKPVYKGAKWKQQTEKELKAIEGLNLVILRVPLFYGAYCTGLMSTSVCMARAYQALGKPLTLLNHSEQPMSTVWVGDIARATWHAANWRALNGPRKPTDIVLFNVADHNRTTKEKVAEAIRKEFHIKVGFVGTLLTQFAKLNAESVVEDMNDETLTIWADIIQKKEITRPGPITPFLEKEMLKETDLCVDGTLFEEVTGFRYEREVPPADWIKEITDSYERMGWWP